MRPTALDPDVAPGHGGNALIGVGIQGLSIHSQKAFHGEILDAGLRLEPLPSVQTTLQRDTDGGDLFDAPFGGATERRFHGGMVY